MAFRYCQKGVGYCFIHAKAMREASLQDKTVSSHTFFHYCFCLGIGEQREGTIMKNESTNEKQTKKVNYVAPSVEVIEVENEGVIAASNLENPYENGPIEW